MAKRYAVTPVLRAGKHVFSASFRNASEIRVTRSLDTADKDFAAMICSGLVMLWNASVRTFEQVPPGVPPESVRLYFDSKADSSERTVGWREGPRESF